MNIPENFDRWMFDYQEGNLSATEMESFENFITQNPQFEAETDAWNNAFVENENFVYANAAALQKDRKVVVGWYSLAAAIALLISSAIFLMPNPSEVNAIGSNNETVEQLDVVAQNQLNVHEANQAFVSNEVRKAYLLSNLEDFHTTNQGTVADNSINNIVDLNSINGANTNVAVDNDLQNNGPSVVDNNLIANNVLNTMEDNQITLLNVDGVTTNRIGVNKNALHQELSKFDSETNNSKYQGNPTVKDLEFDVAKNIAYDYSSWQNKLKRAYYKIEKMFDYPVGLTNLRDPELVMPNSNIMAFNPGFTGGMLASRMELNYRNQWLGTEQSSQQMTLSFDNYLYQMRGGVGVVFNVKDYGLGKLGDYSMSLNYSPKIIVSKNIVFEPAIKMTLGVLNINGSDVEPSSVIEMDRGRVFKMPPAGELSGRQQMFYKDYGLGFVVNTKWFYAGFSADNLNNHFETVYNEEGLNTPMESPVMYSSIVGFDYEAKRRPKDKPMSVSPFVAYQQWGDRKELWAGVNYRINAFTIGGSISQKKDFTISSGIKFEKFKLVYHYDHTMSTVMNKQIGSHNISIRFNGRSKKSRIK